MQLQIPPRHGRRGGGAGAAASASAGRALDGLRRPPTQPALRAEIDRANNQRAGIQRQTVRQVASSRRRTAACGRRRPSTSSSLKSTACPSSSRAISVRSGTQEGSQRALALGVWLTCSPNQPSPDKPSPALAGREKRCPRRTTKSSQNAVSIGEQSGSVFYCESSQNRALMRLGRRSSQPSKQKPFPAYSETLDPLKLPSTYICPMQRH